MPGRRCRSRAARTSLASPGRASWLLATLTATPLGKDQSFAPQRGELPERGVEHDPADRHDEGSRSHCGQEGQRRQRAVLGVLPAQQGLQLVRLAGVDVDQGLVVRQELTVLQCSPQPNGIVGVGQQVLGQQAVSVVPSPLFQQDHDLVGQLVQGPDVARGELPGLRVDDTQRAQRKAVPAHQRDPEIAADVRGARDERVVAVPVLPSGVRHGKRSPGGNDVGAERHGPRGLARAETLLGLEPLPVSIHQRDRGDGRVAQQRRKRRECVVGRLRRGVERPVGRQRVEPVALRLVPADADRAVRHGRVHRLAIRIRDGRSSEGRRTVG